MKNQTKKENEKSNENILIYDISYRTLIGAKSLCIRLDKIHGFIRVHNGTRYLVLISPEIYDAIYSRITYLISKKSGIKYVVFHNYARNKVDSYDSLPLEKTFDFT